jgi:hypothetical protein
MPRTGFLNIMRFLIELIAMYLVILLLFSGVGIGFGFLLCWLIPAIDTGTGVLIGLVSVGGAIHYYERIMIAAAALESSKANDEHEELESMVLQSIRPRRRPRRANK